MKRCTKCKSLMPGDVFLCIRCGFDSRPVAAAPTFKPAGVVKKGKFANGLALAGQAWRVLMLDKELLVFPLLSGIACFLVLATFLGAAFAVGVRVKDPEQIEMGYWIGLFIYYFINYFVIVFFNCALVACAMIRFRGGDPTVRDGLKAARERLGLIAAWALVAATVGVILRMIEERVGFLGKIVTTILGAAWTIATYFVVPVLVVENLGPIDAAKRSAAIVRKAWGESIVGNAGVGILTFLAVLLLVVPCGILTVALAIKMSSIAVGVAGAVLTVALLVTIALVSSALTSILLSALYLFASGEQVPAGFDPARLKGAFLAK
ncbi:MAG TPA: DUF6159 family protein [Burkholderiales bacterium]|nr:DUF6159 family protein [Burkholderiales bacterium]